jgi:hypothetical protein
MARRGLIAVGAVIVAGVIGWLMFAGFRRTSRPAAPARTTAAPVPAAPAPPGRKIKARLFYVAGDGTRLTSVERDVAYGEGSNEQAREIVAAQIAPVAEPLVSAIPAGTTLRALFMSDDGEAYVDLSRELSTSHTGGTQNELLTIYAIVNALTENLPAVMSVQILVDGKEVETLSGHIDLRRPLAKNPDLVQ